VVQALARAGAVIAGTTNMSEFAFSGLGLNPHYGRPLNAYDRTTGRIPGGSSSGAAVSVTDGMAVAAIGTDTGGSIRIPAALCGLTSFKPTARRISRKPFCHCRTRSTRSARSPQASPAAGFRFPAMRPARLLSA
jgi:aspartyl-tRNA(Asn)/glutamyl-tRNA(Gln) amidotransferase subunit A